MDANVPLKDEGIPDQADMEVPLRTSKNYHLLYYVLWILEILLFFRFVLKLLGANPTNAFAELIYGITFVLMLPFHGIFPEKVSSGTHASFDPSIVLAMIVYAIIFWAAAKFLVINTSKLNKSKKK